MRFKASSSASTLSATIRARPRPEGRARGLSRSRYGAGFWERTRIRPCPRLLRARRRASRPWKGRKFLPRASSRASFGQSARAVKGLAREHERARLDRALSASVRSASPHTAWTPAEDEHASPLGTRMLFRRGLRFAPERRFGAPGGTCSPALGTRPNRDESRSPTRAAATSRA